MPCQCLVSAHSRLQNHTAALRSSWRESQAPGSSGPPRPREAQRQRVDAGSLTPSAATYPGALEGPRRLPLCGGMCLSWSPQ
eukprot:2091625-Pyramimonas_sp.AAC.1